MAHIGALLAWFELCVAVRLTACGNRIALWGRQWADAALRHYGHFSDRKRRRAEKRRARQERRA